MDHRSDSRELPFLKAVQRSDPRDVRQKGEMRDTIDIKEAAAVLGVSKFTLYYWAKAHRVPHYRLGRRVLFSRAGLTAWLGRHKVDDAA